VTKKWRINFQLFLPFTVKMASLMEQLENEEEKIQITHQHNIPIEEFTLFAREMRDNETVKMLLLVSNNLTDEMIIELAEALKYNKTLEQLL
jgi:hypothetical protein